MYGFGLVCSVCVFMFQCFEHFLCLRGCDFASVGALDYLMYMFVRARVFVCLCWVR